LVDLNLMDLKEMMESKNKGVLKSRTLVDL